MTSVRGEWWEIDLAPEYVAEMEPDDACVTISHPQGVGALQVSAYQKQDGSPVSNSDLLQETELPPEKQSHLAEQQWGEFRGYQLVYTQEDMFWRRWWLTDGVTFLFVTYNCEKAEQRVELEPVNSMLNSLRSKTSE